MLLVAENADKYYYKCPSTLGYLEITVDTQSKVKTAIFTDTTKRGGELPSAIIKVLDQYFNEKLDIPNSIISKEIKGTVFQKSIWGVIQKVTLGQTITYSDMSTRAGKESAARAAGTACGKNPVALFIPCHRVVRKQREDYGYSWGTKRKKWLLEFEN